MGWEVGEELKMETVFRVYYMTINLFPTKNNTWKGRYTLSLFAK